MANILLYSALAFVLITISTPAIIKLARQKGFVSKPRADRWHQKETALLGGVGIFIAFIIPTVIFAIHARQNFLILLCLSLIFLLGLIDDLCKISAKAKLIGQIIIAILAIISGISISISLPLIFSAILSAFWIVGITNAFNLIDNMDGLSAGISAIVSFFMLIMNFYLNQTNLLAVNAIFFSIMVGFLLYNSKPAKIFMGDAGSLFIGFFLSTSAISMINQSSQSTLKILPATLLIFLVPLLDMAYVIIMRKLNGRKITVGGRDHTSHRLAIITKSEKKPVYLLYGLNILAGITAILLYSKNIALLFISALLLLICAGYLLYKITKVNVYQS